MEIDGRLTIVIATALGAIASAIVVRGLDVFQRWRQERNARRRLVTAIAMEIRHNVDDIERFKERAWSVDRVLETLAAAPKRRLLIPVTRNMVFFDILKTEVGALPSRSLYRVVAFYSHLEKIYTQAAILRSEEFVDISAAGKKVALDRFIELQNETADLGTAALKELRDELPRLVPSFVAGES